MLDRGHVIIPIKGLIRGKSRLAAHLPSMSVYLLNLANLDRTVRAAVEFFGPDRCVVVSPCKLTCDTVRLMGLRVLFQDLDDGLNAGVEYARAHVRAAGASTITVLPVDLAHVSAVTLQAALGRCMGPGLAAVVPDTDAQGTNLLSMPADFDLMFAFGCGSFESHLRQLRAGGLSVRVAEPCALQEDIDTIEQLRRVCDTSQDAVLSIPMCHVAPYTKHRSHFEF
ncbi:hypothetical protein [Hydrogenophaga sp.]|uniref:hypothetical protein n=1 Tax=Hydrogenophaga sp. TaxID=1904254 RepID=UPI00271A8327|nr:hypothetical protein [Hydrogenophaga sp.]MDO9435934.1 hypothetical protein [Hydrogenophaga sp.]